MSFIVPSILVVPFFIVFFFLTILAFQVPQLPPDEVEGLKYVGKILGIDWNLSANPCSPEFAWVPADHQNDLSAISNITCNCEYLNHTVCHVTHIVLQSLNLGGTLPSDLSRLPYLKVLDLVRTYISGQIPPQWGSTKLCKISLLGNRLTGPIPEEIGNITTLQELVLESSHLSGTLPSTLGNLVKLERLLLGSNNFTGELPTSLGMLTSLTQFRISDNNFVGQIPSFIRNWVNISLIVIQGSGLSGPIPSEIGLLNELIDMRISDLNGASSPFPSLNNLTNINYLVLRNCNITGVLPDYLAKMTTLRILDLSFNKISGEIPPNFHDLAGVQTIFLTGNLLNGSVPGWMLHDGEVIDLSYNKFAPLPADTNCQTRNMNFFASSSLDNDSKLVSCLRKITCGQVKYHIYINCGGKEEIINGVTFEGDEDTGKPSQFRLSQTNWAFSNTGSFLDNHHRTYDYIAVNSSTLSMKNSKLYETARLTPLSLTYYVYCLASSNYTISLHFAEITFTNDKSFTSLGRRVFDVYVQGRRVLKDFNIVDAAGGVGKAFIHKIPISVTNGTLEIRFYWAGKGTTVIPSGGVYGPLISAISIVSDSDPSVEPLVEIRNNLSIGAIVGISAAIVLFIILALGTLWSRGCLGRKSRHPQDLEGLNIGPFSLKQITTATNNFDTSNKIGEGGFGPVYKVISLICYFVLFVNVSFADILDHMQRKFSFKMKGILLDGTMIAVKKLSSNSKQGKREFVNEIGVISSLQHPYLVKLYGCCTEGPQECQLELNWPTRQKICIGLAKGLAFLHEESGLKIVHRDIKGSNVLLDENLNPKISDFGLAKLDEEENTHMTTRIAGTFGYMAPEYATRGYLTDKADIYSFGIVTLEIVSGRSNAMYRSKDKCLYLLDWALVVKEKGDLMELVDPRLGSNFDQGEAMAMINIALLCTNVSPSARPTMTCVVSMLEGKAAVEELSTNPNDLREEINAMWTIMHQNQKLTDNDIQTESASSLDILCTSSSTSI
ncbi:probable leucine-rich repeat receptor-like serine/threonine-protein kinase At3g14840 isoform X2 [Benincasa hispida]|uniref:probable leucine-rich repeat receptor-like serine/threonine-protein kinase At3g14840 isoform X2 n=1 Tax=Benincasa hispida TaxID=102211 RepID=UPI00190063FE|nr:probable leucine-rich repeat receptor-like serine/threonine-protein kinase At3g14840 isoform X2 [Benincasa hispida]